LGFAKTQVPNYTIKVQVLLFLFTFELDAPPSPLLDSKKSNYVKGGSRWDLVSLPASNTKGG